MALQMSCQNNRQKHVDLSDGGGEKWVKYYSSHHQILLVGEGDFSFSLSLAQSFGSAFNIVASSLDAYDQVVRKYKKAMSNLIALTKMGACVLHGVDATQMKFHPYLEMRRFDRIIFNFPHAGFHGKEDNFSVIQKHKDLVRGFFMNASSMLRSNGEIHVNHKTNPPFDAWCIPELGIRSFLWPIGCMEFRKEDYPGYNNKRGDGPRCDEPFPLGKCSTFKFALLTKNDFYATNQTILGNHHYPLISLNPHSPPSAISCRNRHLPMLEGGGGYLNGGIDFLGRVGYVSGASCDLQRSLWSESTVFGHPQTDYVMNMDMILGKQVSGYVHGFSSDLQRSSWPKSTEFSYPPTGHVRNMDTIGGRHLPMLEGRGGYLNGGIDFLGRVGYVDGTSCDLQRSLRSESTVFGHPQTDYVMNMDMILGKQVSGYVHGISSDLHRSS